MAPYHVEIWHTCRLDEYLGILFLFFENLPFWALWTRFSLKLGFSFGLVQWQIGSEVLKSEAAPVKCD